MTKSQLKQYILRKLGSPVMNIEISEDQLADCIDDALEKFYENHYDGVDIGYVFLNIAEGTQEYTLDANIQDVIDVLGHNNFSYSDDPLLIKESLQFGSSTLSPYTDLIDVEIWRQNINNLQSAFSKEVLFDFNSTSKKLFLHISPKEDSINSLKVYKSDSDLTKLYSNIWLKKYATALSKKQWATNIQKFTGVTLPGGGQFNYADIMAQAETEIERLEEDLDDRYSEPYDMFYA